MAILLSFSTIDLYNKCNYSWLNKVNEVPTIDFKCFKDGRDAHDVIEAHLSGAKRLKKLEEKLPFTLPFGEEMLTMKINDKWGFRGKIDRYSLVKNLEIKTGGDLYWSISKYKKSYQRMCYCLLNPGAKESILFNSTFDLSRQKVFGPVPTTEKDKALGMKYILDAIKSIEGGNFDVPEKAPCYRCVYKDYCSRGK